MTVTGVVRAYPSHDWFRSPVHLVTGLNYLADLAEGALERYREILADPARCAVLRLQHHESGVNMQSFLRNERHRMWLVQQKARLAVEPPIQYSYPELVEILTECLRSFEERRERLQQYWGVVLGQ